MSDQQKTSHRKKSSESQTKWFIAPLLRSATGRHRLENVRNGHVLAESVTGAFDSKSRRVGLLHRASFSRGHALIIAPCNAIHTFFMRFAIDVAFVTRRGRIVKIRSNVQPWRIALAIRASAVVELPAGTLDACDTVRGDTLAIAGDGC